jgi:two-component system chemotaxis response regulator CheB
MRLTPGQVVVAPGGRHVRISSGLAVVLTSEPAEARHIPSIDITMRSAARSRPGRVLGILLTGMGEDGADGMTTIRAGGGVTIAESESSCVVYGMPRAAVRRGGASLVLPLEEIAALLAALSP